MIVYRIQDSEKMGPYRNSGTCIGLAFNHYDHQHPNLVRDLFHFQYLNKIGKQVEPNIYSYWDMDLKDKEDFSKYVFGFENISQITKWFNKSERDLLKENGFKIHIFEIDPNYVLEGKSKRQIMFKMEEGEFIYSLEWDDIE